MFDHFVGLTLKWLKRVKNLADLTSFKKKNPLNKVNYRPASALLSISKNFEKTDAETNKCLIIYPYICVGIGKALVYNRLYCHTLKTVKTFSIKKLLE